MSWKTIERPGYFGKKRNELYSRWNEQLGDGNWRIAYEWGSLVIPRKEAIQIYEDGYYEFLKADLKTLEWLTTTASDVYDTAPSNIEARFSYDKQETPNNHVHDVAIRRAVMRLGKWFNGDHLIHVRGEKTEGAKISPGVVPFHLPDMIVKEEINDYGEKGFWWEQNSVEDFYQRNKVLQVKDETK